MKNRKFEGIIDKKIGWGDVFIFLSVGICIEPLYMIWFFTGTFILSLVFHLFFVGKEKNVPLAGFVILFYLVWMILKYFIVL
jgi:hypothetical protein